MKTLITTTFLALYSGLTLAQIAPLIPTEYSETTPYSLKYQIDTDSNHVGDTGRWLGILKSEDDIKYYFNQAQPFKIGRNLSFTYSPSGTHTYIELLALHFKTIEELGFARIGVGASWESFSRGDSIKSTVTQFFNEGGDITIYGLLPIFFRTDFTLNESNNRTDIVFLPRVLIDIPENTSSDNNGFDVMLDLGYNFRNTAKSVEGVFFTFDLRVGTGLGSTGYYKSLGYTESHPFVYFALDTGVIIAKSLYVSINWPLRATDKLDGISKPLIGVQFLNLAN